VEFYDGSRYLCRVATDIIFFGKLADMMGVRRMAYTGTAQHLLALRDEIFAQALAEGGVTIAAIRMSVNRVQTAEDVRLSHGDEIAFFPVFSGG